MAARSSKIPTILLTAFCIVLATLVWFELRHPPRLDVGRYEPEPLSVEGDENAPPKNLVAPPPLNHYKEIIERPLFIAERRPPKEEPEAEEEPEPENEFVLQGVILLPEGKAVLIRVDESIPVDDKKRPRGKQAVRRGESKVVRLQMGKDDMVNGWRLEAVEENKVILRKGEETREVLLERNREQPALKQTAAARQAAARRAAATRRKPGDQRAGVLPRTVAAKRQAGTSSRARTPAQTSPRAVAPKAGASSKVRATDRRQSPQN